LLALKSSQLADVSNLKPRHTPSSETHLWRIVLGQRLQGFLVDDQRALQLSLVGVQAAELDQRADARVLVRRSVPQSGAVDFGSVAEDERGLVAPSERYQRRAHVEISHWKREKRESLESLVQKEAELALRSSLAKSIGALSSKVPIERFSAPTAFLMSSLFGKK
jgi:hypothetical protein